MVALEVFLEVFCSLLIGKYAHFLFLSADVFFISFNAKGRFSYAYEQWDKTLGSNLKCFWAFFRMGLFGSGN